MIERMTRSLTGGVLAGVLAMVLAGCGENEQARAPEVGPGDATATAAADAPHPGEAVYNNFCFSCHAAGVSGAPKLGDKEAWAPRIAKGQDLLLQATIEGVPPAMPAKGMCFNCSDEELASVVDYMVQQAQ